ncbi:hypothetical protein WG899_20660 [Paucibacter sp. AS339]|uniref:hypothetical protein n=1 Tax=Paucibacter hankyongi TaxID=3133434 RepID=UPI0030A21E0F
MKCWTRKFGIGAFGGLLMVVQASSAGAIDSSMAGIWGGDRLQLTIDAKGSAKLETDCASGAIDTPLALNADGSFKAFGTFTQHHAGPERADIPAGSTKASYKGQVTDGSLMTLTIQSDAAKLPEVFTLRKGVKVKLIRCL